MSWRGTTKLRRWARFAGRRISPGALALLYHRVAEVEYDPWSLCVSPRHFAEHVEVLRGRVRPLAALTGPEPDPSSVAITFDDGYADVLLAARPILERCAAPASVFVATGPVASGQPFWWDELEALRQATSDGRGAGRVDDRLRDQLSALSGRERRAQLDALRAEAEGAPDVPAELRALTPDELLRLAEGGLVEIGAHSVSHPRLPVLEADSRDREIRDSRAFLESLLGREVTSFAYPHGLNDPSTRSSVEEAGFARAFTSATGVVRARTDRLRLPRVQVPDCDGETFERFLFRLGWG